MNMSSTSEDEKERQQMNMSSTSEDEKERQPNVT
jgi:hypothetical protein